MWLTEVLCLDQCVALAKLALQITTFKQNKQTLKTNTNHKTNTNPEGVQAQLGKTAHRGVLLNLVGLKPYTFMLFVASDVFFLVSVGLHPRRPAASLLFQFQESVDVFGE